MFWSQSAQNTPPKIPPGEIDETDPDEEDPGSRAQAFARQIAADEAQEKRANITEEERFIEIQEKRAQMIANDRKRAERSKQRANTRGSAVTEPLEIDDDTDENDNDSDNDNREDDLFSNNSNENPDKGGYRDHDCTHKEITTPMTTNPVTTATPTMTTLSQPMTKNKEEEQQQKKKPQSESR